MWPSNDGFLWCKIFDSLSVRAPSDLGGPLATVGGASVVGVSASLQGSIVNQRPSGSLDGESDDCKQFTGSKLLGWDSMVNRAV